MKLLAFAAVAGAFVIPDASMVNQLVLADKEAPAVSSGVVDAIKSGVDAVGEWLRDHTPASGSDAKAFDSLDELNADFGAESSDMPVFDPIVVGGKAKTSNLTIYQLISGCNVTTKFAALVNEFPAVVELLNATAADLNHTLFVPVDSAFDALPGGGLNETTTPKAVRENIVRYHIGLGDLPYKVLFATHTVASAYNEPLLGGEAQRLRVRFEKKLGVRVNFAAKIVAPNFVAANGVLHALDTVLVPPTFVGRQLSFVPDHYSTLLLAMQVSNFTQFIHGLTNLNGSTVLAPSNAAFTLLGPELNAFLFNTPRGLKYLHALLRYQTVPNATVYSDAFYGPPELAPSPSSAIGGGLIERLHYQLPTLLGNATVSLNVTSVPGYTAMMVNNKVRVSVQDGVAKNGVIQEVDRVVFPPPQASTIPGNPWADPPVQTVADLVARLSPYVEDDEEETVVPAPGKPIGEL